MTLFRFLCRHEQFVYTVAVVLLLPSQLLLWHADLSLVAVSQPARHAE
jgi:hypothetical protein